jgi:hypothetical protein
MSVMVTELYDALRKAGVDEPLARDAARAVLGANARTELATKDDIARLEAATKIAMADMKVELIKWNVGAMALLSAIHAAISGLR